MIGIDHIAPIQNSNRLQVGLGSEHESALHPAALQVFRLARQRES
jgi:hypothetical protein